jgi:fructose-1,6-bisphosphatase/inositol monophosphatase family enzyme
VPGTLIMKEAGGAAAHLDGSRYVPAVSTKRGLLVAANEDIWRTVRDELFPDL